MHFDVDDDDEPLLRRAAVGVLVRLAKHDRAARDAERRRDARRELLVVAGPARRDTLFLHRPPTRTAPPPTPGQQAYEAKRREAEKRTAR